MEESQLYKKSATHYIVGITSSIVYCMAKLGLVIYQLVAFSKCDSSIPVNDNLLNQWLIAIAVHAFFYILIQFVHLNYINNPDNRQDLAMKLDQTLLNVNQDQAPLNFFEDSKQISLLAKQIKCEVWKSSICGKFMIRLFGVYYQFLFFWGVWLFFTTEKTGCSEFSYYFLCAVLILYIYQYIDLYIILMGCVIFSPCLIIFAIYFCCQHCSQQQVRQEARARTNILKYKPTLLKGDQECSICRSAYELGEIVIILKCSELHHYHESCIMSWMNINRTCPLCRHPI